MVDECTGALVVTGATRRLTKEEVALVREAIQEGREVVFPDRHRWRHFQVRL